MLEDHGFNELGNRMVSLLHYGPPDFDAAEELIRLGCDLNAAGRSDSDNMLSEILKGYRYDAFIRHGSDPLDAGQQIREQEAGPAMCSVIRFFLDHGFDVSKQDGCYGAQCLWALVLSTGDRYIIDATKLLLDAGAKNRSISPDMPDETPWNFIGCEGSFQDCTEHDHYLGNIYEAVYQIYQAIEDGRPYDGIDSYEAAVGKRIRKVLARHRSQGPVFYPLDLPNFKKENCYTADLYFVYDGGALLTTQFADLWTDTVLPDGELTDVSDRFSDIVGHQIQRITFDHRDIAKGTTHYGQPIIRIEMDNGNQLMISINFGEVKKHERAAFYELTICGG